VSKIISETEDYLIVEDYLHSNVDEYDDWEFDGRISLNTPPKYGWDFSETWGNRLMEVKFTLKVDKKTGKYVILSVQDGDQLLIENGDVE
jgi:hypothetical protein